MRGRRFKTQADIDRYIQQGYGQGEGPAYMPWLRVQDVPSSGRSRKVNGVKVDRIHHLLSDLEYTYFLALEFSEQVVEIREQFPLFPIAQVQDVATRLGIRYPKYPGTSVPYVMTTDFHVSVCNADGSKRLVARTVKYESDLSNPAKLERVLEKLEIERVFWMEKDVDWGIVTDGTIGPILAENLQFLRGAARIERHLLRPEIGLRFLDALDQLPMSERALSSMVRAASNSLHLPYKDGVALFKHLVSNKAISFDITSVRMKLTSPSPALKLIGLTNTQSVDPKAA